MFARHQLKREGRLTADDLAEIGKGRRPQHRLGFAYQLAFVRLLNRFPQQQGFQVIEDLVNFSALQLSIDAALIDQYRKRQPTISERQQTITSYLGLRTFGAAEAALLERFVFEESCRHVSRAVFWRRSPSP